METLSYLTDWRSAHCLPRLITVVLTLMVMSCQSRAGDQTDPPIFNWEIAPSLRVPSSTAGEDDVFRKIFSTSTAEPEPFWDRDQRAKKPVSSNQVATLLGFPQRLEVGLSKTGLSEKGIDWNTVPQFAAIIFPCLASLAGSLLLSQKSSNWQIVRSPESAGHA